ncbi:MAG TPA: ABC transporter permease [Dehalococcoidales bacterium]|nr:ABC transporter permease [Dehalococcoidales bacterium]
MMHLLRSYGLMLKWQALSNKTILPFNLIVQLMIATGFIIGIGFFYPQISPDTAKYLTTGAPLISLLTVGLVLVPQVVALGRTAGTFDYIWSLPVPRLVYVAADATIWILVSLPGVIISLILGSIYFQFGLEVNLLVIPAIALIAMTGTFVGYSIAHAAPKPEIAQLATQIIIFGIMLFSPIMYPLEQLPDWMASVHQVLPIKYMADLLRGTLTDLPVNLGLAFALVGGWCLFGLAATSLLVRRRQ